MTRQNDNFKPNPNNAQANLNTADHPRHRRMLEPLISLYQDGETSAAEELTVERYLATCAECRKALDGYDRVETQLQGYLDQVGAPRPLPSFSLNGQTRHNSATERFDDLVPAYGARPTRPASSGRNRWLTPAMVGRFSGAIAAMLVLVSIVGLVLIYRDNGTPPAGTGQTVVASQSQTPEPTSPPSPSPLPTTTPTVALTAEPTATVALQTTVAATTASAGQTTQAAINPAQTTAARQTTAAAVAPINTPKPAAAATPTPNSSTAAPSTARSETATPTVAIASTTNTAAATTAPATTTAPTAETGTTVAPVVTTTVAAPPATSPASTETAAPTATPVPATTAAPVSLPPTPTAAALPSPTSSRVPATPGPLTVNAPGWIAYVSNQDGEIHLVNSDGSTEVSLSKDSVANGIRWEELVWSHDGRWIAAAGQNTGTGGYAIYLFDITNRNDGKLNFAAEGFGPVWSPDDLSMAYLAGPVRSKNGLKQGKPALINLKKRFVQSPVTLEDEYQSLRPQWFEEGTRLLIGQNQIVAPDGTLLNTLELPYENTCVATGLSPFGNKLAVLEPNGPVIYDLNKGTIDKNKPLARPTVTIPGKAGAKCGGERLHWTPSGRSVYFYVNGGGNDTTCVVSISGGGASCLTGVYQPSFTVDGGHLVDFNPNQRGQLYAMPFGNKPDNIRILASSRVPPVWQPRWS